MRRALETLQKNEQTQTGSILDTIPEPVLSDLFARTTPIRDDVKTIQVSSKHGSFVAPNNPCVDKRTKILVSWVLSNINSGQASMMISNLDDYASSDVVMPEFRRTSVRDGTVQYEFTVSGPGNYEITLSSIDNKVVSGGTISVRVPDLCTTASPPPILVEPAGGTNQPPTKTNTKPSLTIPKAITREATGPSGAVVNFSVSGQDKEDGAIIPSCSHPSDYMFPIGTTTVSCTVDDSNNNSISGTFTVTIRDTTGPAIASFQPREGVRDESGVQVFYDVTASDLVDGTVPVTCNYPSGYKFPPGTTNLTCTAMDSRGNQSSRTLQITVTITESGQ
jgi:hypothetical protein